MAEPLSTDPYWGRRAPHLLVLRWIKACDYRGDEAVDSAPCCPRHVCTAGKGSRPMGYDVDVNSVGVGDCLRCVRGLD